jgi:transposase
MTEAEVSELRIQNLDHLGIVAGVIDRIGLVERVNERLGTSPDELISSGQIVKAMILNGLGFVSAPMYLFSRFFEGKPTEHLLGEGVRPEHLNDDKIARVLEKLSEAGLRSLFVEIALDAAEREGVATARLHLDATSFSVHGRYPQAESQNQEEEEGPKSIHITYGYSRDHRPDLKQFLVDLMVSGEGGVPLFFRVSDGNESDAAVFAELIRNYQAQLDLETLFVADAALYDEENLKCMGTLKYISRVPQTIKRAEALSEGLDEEGLAFSEATKREGYRVAEIEAEYAGFEQRWIVVESDKRAQGDLKRVEERVGREEAKTAKALRALRRRPFNCERDASEAAKKLAKGLRYTGWRTSRLRPNPTTADPAGPARARHLGIATAWRRPSCCARRRR